MSMWESALEKEFIQMVIDRVKDWRNEELDAEDIMYLIEDEIGEIWGEVE